MKAEDIQLVCIEETGSKTWCVYPNGMKGLVVQVKNLDDASKELAKSFEALLRHGFDNETHIIKP